MPRYGNNIYKRKDGRFEGRYIKDHINGRAKYGYVYAKSYNETKNKLFEIRTGKVKICANDKTINNLFVSWLNHIKPNIKESTFMLYQNIINNHLIPPFDKIKVQTLTSEQINRFINNKSELAVKTVHGIFGVLNNAMKYAINENIITYNPCSNVKLPKIHNKEIEIFTPEQQFQLETACDIGVLICLYTGLRIGEICALKWGDIDFYNGTLRVRRTVQRIKNSNLGSKTKIITTLPKTKDSERSIPIPKFLINKLLLFKKISDDYILTVKGKQMEPRTYQYRFKKLLKKLNLPSIPFHGLRHTFSTRALELGFDIKTLSEILGHHNASVTLKTYAHSILEHKRTQMNLFEKLQK